MPLGTKTGGEFGTPGTSTSSALVFFELVIILVVIAVAIKFWLPNWQKKASNRVNLPLNSQLRIEEQATCGPGKLYVVSVRGRTLLLGATPNSISSLADLTQEELPAPTEFEKVMSQENSGADGSYFPHPNDIQTALDRLGRIQNFDA